MKKRNKKAFTIIELIVVIAILGILVLLGMSNFTGQVKEANHAKRMVATKTIEDASSMYHMDSDDWPRLTDEPYTAEQLKEFADGYYDSTGKEIVLDPKGNYYNIDYDKLSQYAKAPENKKQYILQNPVGKIFYMENIQPAGEERVEYVEVVKPSQPSKQVNSSIPSKPSLTKSGENSILVSSEDGTEVRLNVGDWFTSPHTFESIEVGQNYSAEVRFKETEDCLASKSTQVSFDTVESSGETYDFTYTGSAQEFTVLSGGQYKLEVWGAQGGSYTEEQGKGGYSKGSIILTKNQIVRVMVGGKGVTSTSSPGDNGQSNRYAIGGWNGGGHSGSGGYKAGSGGGATDIRINGSSLMQRAIVSGGGGGQGNSEGIPGEGGGLMGLSARFSYDSRLNGTGGTQTKPGNFGGSFGQGGQFNSNHSGGGGGGWYGGGAGQDNSSSAGGGSGYVHTAGSHKPAGWQLTEEHYLTETEMIAGNQLMPNPAGGTMTGNSGHGFARITSLDSWGITEK